MKIPVSILFLTACAAQAWCSDMTFETKGGSMHITGIDNASSAITGADSLHFQAQGTSLKADLPGQTIFAQQIYGDAKMVDGKYMLQKATLVGGVEIRTSRKDKTTNKDQSLTIKSKSAVMTVADESNAKIESHGGVEVNSTGPNPGEASKALAKSAVVYLAADHGDGSNKQYRVKTAEFFGPIRISMDSFDHKGKKVHTEGSCQHALLDQTSSPTLLTLDGNVRAGGNNAALLPLGSLTTDQARFKIDDQGNVIGVELGKGTGVYGEPAAEDDDK
jgi:hypothetical protein